MSSLDVRVQARLKGESHAAQMASQRALKVAIRAFMFAQCSRSREGLRARGTLVALLVSVHSHVVGQVMLQRKRTIAERADEGLHASVQESMARKMDDALAALGTGHGHILLLRGLFLRGGFAMLALNVASQVALQGEFLVALGAIEGFACMQLEMA